MKFDIQKIDNKRIMLGWTRGRLALLAGVNQSTLSYIFHNHHVGKPDTYKKLAEAVGLTMEDICIEEPEVMQSR